MAVVSTAALVANILRVGIVLVVVLRPDLCGYHDHCRGLVYCDGAYDAGHGLRPLQLTESSYVFHLIMPVNTRVIAVR